MAFYSHLSDRSSDKVTLGAHEHAQAFMSLPMMLCERDLLFLIVLFVITVPDIPTMEFAGYSMLFYWGLAFLLFIFPCIFIGGWLTRQTPAQVPVFVWIIRLLDARWRSSLLVLLWWIGVLAMLSVLGVCLSQLQNIFPHLLGSLFAQSLVFIVLLALVTLLVGLSSRFLRIVLGVFALLYLGFFVLLGCAACVCLLRGHATASSLPHAVSSGAAGSFSWPVFGLTLLSLLGLNMPFLRDGEMRRTRSYLRHTKYLWWVGVLVLLVFTVATAALLIIEPASVVVMRYTSVKAIEQVFGPEIGLLARFLILASYFGVVVAYFSTFSRVQLLATCPGRPSRSLVKLNRVRVPLKSLLVLAISVAAGALFLLLLVPVMLKAWLPAISLDRLLVGDQYRFLVSMVGSLWAVLTALLFIFAFWVFQKKRRRGRQSGWECVVVPWMCIVGILTSFICACSPMMEKWPNVFFSQNHWFPFFLAGLTCSLLLAWLVSELPRRSALLSEQRSILEREKALRKKLQQACKVQCEAYSRERDLHSRLQEAYDEQQISILQQKILLDELNRLYREQERAAITDPVTGLPNHRAFIQSMDEEIANCQGKLRSCLVFFIDLDHFKEINDTWGHLAGDSVLCEVARRLRCSLGSKDFVSRYGGEEFALIMSKSTMIDAYEVANRLRQVIRSTPCEWKCVGEQMAGISVTASIGVAEYGVHGTRREELIEKADLAMYQAKLDGRDCVRLAEVPALPRQQSVFASRALSRCQRRQAECLVKDKGGQMQVSVQALQALSAVIHIRDHTTGAHSQRLIRFAEETARRLDASCEDLFLIRLGGLLHDLGKIVVPDTILNKAGPLTEEEWEVMHLHPQFGARILEETGGVFQSLAPVVLAHHERWDGKGYPLRLSGLIIPFPARVLSVVDAYDAMISRRVYKEPISPDCARAELRRCAGTQFDPAVVGAFLATLDKIESEQGNVSPHQAGLSLVYKSRTLFEETAW